MTMTHALRARIAEVSAALDGASAHAAATAVAADRNAAANRRLDAASSNLTGSSVRIANALAGMAESATRLRAAEARLTFQSARLKRSSKNIREGLDRLGRAGEVLQQRAREARAVAETADRTAVLIAAIESAAARGDAIDHLIAAGREIATAADTRRRAP